MGTAVRPNHPRERGALGGLLVGEPWHDDKRLGPALVGRQRQAVHGACTDRGKQLGANWCESGCRRQFGGVLELRPADHLKRGISPLLTRWHERAYPQLRWGHEGRDLQHRMRARRLIDCGIRVRCAHGKRAQAGANDADARARRLLSAAAGGRWAKPRQLGRGGAGCTARCCADCAEHKGGRFSALKGGEEDCIVVQPAQTGQLVVEAAPAVPADGRAAWPARHARFVGVGAGAAVDSHACVK
eukprot:scaffold271437_cov27-Tisochrysis_lutea.AAC.2